MGNWDSTSAHSHKPWNDRNRMRKWLLTFFLPKATTCALRLLVFHASFSKPGENILPMFPPSHLPHFYLLTQRPPFPSYLFALYELRMPTFGKTKIKVQLPPSFACLLRFLQSREDSRLDASTGCQMLTQSQLKNKKHGCAEVSKSDGAVKFFSLSDRPPSICLQLSARWEEHHPLLRIRQTATNHFSSIDSLHCFSSWHFTAVLQRRTLWAKHAMVTRVCWAPLLSTWWWWFCDHQTKANSW